MHSRDPEGLLRTGRGRFSRCRKKCLEVGFRRIFGSIRLPPAASRRRVSRHAAAGVLLHGVPPRIALLLPGAGLVMGRVHFHP